MAKYYHITSIDNVSSILENGLLANANGEIFLFENVSIVTYGVANNSKGKRVFGKIKRYVADSIAINQVFLEDYAMFEIDEKGINEALINDNVADCTSKFQWIAKQSVIKPQYIDFWGIFSVGDEPTELIEEIQEVETQNDFNI